MRTGEAHPLQAVDVAAGPQQLAEREPVAELDAVGVDVLAQQGDLDDALVDEGLDLGQDVAGTAVGLLATQAGDDAEGAGVVAAHRDRHPAGVGRVAASRQRAGEHLEALEDLDLGAPVVPGPVEQCREAADVVGAEHDVDPGRPLHDGGAVLLGHAASDRDLHVGVLGLRRSQLAEVAVELVVGILPHRAGVEHDDVGGLRARLRGQAVDVDVAGRLEQAGKPLGVVHVHLATVRADVVGPGGCGGTHRTPRVRALPDEVCRVAPTGVGQAAHEALSRAGAPAPSAIASRMTAMARSAG